MAAIYCLDLPIICLLVFSDTSSHIFLTNSFPASAVLEQLPFTFLCQIWALVQASQSESSTPQTWSLRQSCSLGLGDWFLSGKPKDPAAKPIGLHLRISDCWKKNCFENCSWDGGIWSTGGHSLPEKVVKKRKADMSDGKKEVGGRDWSPGTLLESLYSALPKASLVWMSFSCRRS